MLTDVQEGGFSFNSLKKHRFFNIPLLRGTPFLGAFSGKAWGIHRVHVSGDALPRDMYPTAVPDNIE
ncbi:hypothetical protein D5E77_24820 [Vibrio parahaemolyticus]|nr:hypothetical protein D5E77_24820 [Vibrio parahaemolyticus]